MAERHFLPVADLYIGFVLTIFLVFFKLLLVEERKTDVVPELTQLFGHLLVRVSMVTLRGLRSVKGVMEVISWLRFTADVKNSFEKFRYYFYAEVRFDTLCQKEL